MDKAITPTTLTGVKRLASEIKRTLGVQHARALDEAALRGGYQNYTHARRVLNEGPAAPRAKSQLGLFISAYWVEAEGCSGRETLVVTTRQRLSMLVNDRTLKCSRDLMKFRIDADDHLEARHDFHDQRTARLALCAAARALQFMETTGLRPCYPTSYAEVDRFRQLPRRDHETWWRDARRGSKVVVDEPYSHPEDLLPRRQEWARHSGTAVGATAWPGIYAPGSACLYLTDLDGDQTWVDGLVERLDRQPDPIVAEPWAGVSAPYRPVFVTPHRKASGRAKRARPVPRFAGYRRGRAVLYTSAPAPKLWRPDAVMHRSLHREAGNLLKEILAQSVLPSHTRDAVAGIRARLSDWAKLEHRVQAHHAGDEIDGMYFYEHRSTGTSPKQAIEQIKAMVTEHYPDCPPRHDLVKRLDRATAGLAKRVDSLRRA